MAARDREHLIVPTPPASEDFRRAPGGGGTDPRPHPVDRRAHGTRLKAEVEQAVAPLESDRPDAGIRITFESVPGLDMPLESFDVRRAGAQPHLLSVRAESRDDEIIEFATVFIPTGKRGHFVKKVDDYLRTLNATTTKNEKLVESVNAVRRATLRELWTDDPGDFPTDKTAIVWWEVWLVQGDGERSRFEAFVEQNRFRTSSQYLGFNDRTIVLLEASLGQLAETFEALDDIAELRRPHQVATILTELPATEQAEWVAELQGRLSAAAGGAPVVCVLDQGIDASHPLLAGSLAPADSHAAEPGWDAAPHMPNRHGTEIAGLALFGDLEAAILSSLPVTLEHRLESVKILPDAGVNDPDLYGAVTARAVDRPEIEAPSRVRIFLLAVTAQHSSGTAAFAGQPTAWSASIDALAFGRAIDQQDQRFLYLDRDEPTHPRLFTISAGNVRDLDPSDNHLDRSDVEPVEDPAQSWNALTVGAYSDRDDMSGAAPGFAGYVPVAPRGELSPESRTSAAFDGKNWPFKPEVVASGGNVARDPSGRTIDTPENLALLTTRFRQPGEGFFTTTRATSAASAQVAAIAADLHAAYPGIRPETVRALVVHSAEWTPTMRARFDADTTRAGRVKLLRRYGMGVPNKDRALRSAVDALTLVAESTIRPFEWVEGRTDARAREMNVHELPWPAEELEALADAKVRLRVTLSYFVEPNPSRRGWSGRWTYPSFGLRFAVKRPEDSLSDFRSRLNELARADEVAPAQLGTEDGWTLGRDQQTRPGSLHTDIWTGTAADLASKGAVAVYPVSGWWKYRRGFDQSEQGVPYSLVVSIESPEVEVDLWTPVAQQIAASVVTEVET